MPLFVWTDHQAQLLTVMWEQKYHASQIAEALGGGFTRSSVLAKAHRMQLPGRLYADREPYKTKKVAA